MNWYHNFWDGHGQAQAQTDHWQSNCEEWHRRVSDSRVTVPCVKLSYMMKDNQPFWRLQGMRQYETLQNMLESTIQSLFFDYLAK